MAFASSLGSFADAIAVITESGERVSYAELAARADAFALEVGAAPKLVQIEAMNALEPFVAYLGCLRAGHPVLLSAEGAHDPRLRQVFQPDLTYARLGAEWRLVWRDAPPARFHPELAVLLSTSGTTGATKLVRLSATSIEANAASIAEYLGLSASERPITSLPFHYSYGLSVVNSHLRVGATLLLTDRSVVDDEFWSLMTREGATSLSGVPYTYELLRRVGFDAMAPRSLTTLTQAGGRLPPEEVRSLALWCQQRGAKFFVMYGQTEATARMAYLPPSLAAESPDAIGIAIPGGTFTLRGEGGTVVTESEVEGELFYTGPNVMMGYATSRDDLAKGSEIEVLATGDLATRDASGLYRIVGRKSRFAKLFGLRISLDEIEAEIRRTGGRGVAVSDDKLLYIALLSGDPSETVEHLSQTYELPKSAIFAISINSISTLPSGKIDYRTTLVHLQNQNKSEKHKLRSSIRDTFASEFSGKIISDDSSFVSLGGDSLNYVNISVHIEDNVGFLPEEWEKLSISQLESLSPVKRGSSFFGMRDLESEVFIRMLAIVAVITSHSSDLVVSGGAEILLVLAGYNLCRYQKSNIITGSGLNIVLSFAKKILIPYYCLLAVFFVVNRNIDIPSLVLAGNVFGRFGSILEPFWFIEVLAQVFLIVAIMSLFSPVRRSIANDPWRFGLICIAGALVLKCGAFAIFQHAALENRTVDSVLLLVAIGWCLREAVTPARRGIMTAVMIALAVVGATGINGVWPAWPGLSGYSHAVWLCASAVGLLWVRRLRLPSWLHMGIGAIAASSFYIYVTHVIPLWIIYWQLEVKTLAVNLTACLVVGLASAPLFRWWERLEWPPLRSVWPRRSGT
ncbi:AMP-binding protein [Phenylobacterium sp.]|uniref:AMP-binding protein n=1 Tax=Phenylobacterium sp. TaxID=1871053 RepID=UPI0037CA3AD0